MSDRLALLLTAAGFVLVAFLIFLVFYAINQWRKRIEALENVRSADWRMMQDHQDILANHDSRLQRLGSPSPAPVPTIRQMAEGFSKAARTVEAGTATRV